MEESVLLNPIPVHVGIIMDGNGRWAKQRNLPRTNGHTEGLKRAKEITKIASKIGLRFLTLYVFSTENWKRTKQEVGFLMNLIHTRLLSEFDFCKHNNIRVRMIGDKDRLPGNVKEDIEEMENDTQNLNGMTLCLAINYGGKDEIIRGIRRLIENGTKASEVCEELIKKNFDVPYLPDLDLLIRTGGEKRLSNFLMWQSAYAELIFKNTLWPDYKEEEFLHDISEFQMRVRKFGTVLS